MNFQRNHASILLCASVSLWLFLLSIPAEDAPSSPFLKPDAGPEEILNAFQSQWIAMKDYCCVLDTKVRRGEKSDHTILQFWFKHPNYFRSVVLEGNDKGVIVTRGAAGKIKAQKGGILSAIKLTLKEDDARLADPRGARLQDGDWGSLIGQFLHRRDQGWSFRRLPDEKVKGALCYVVQAEGRADDMGETREAFCFEKQTLTVRARRLWEGPTQVDDTVYYDVKLDQKLSDDFFNPN